MVGPLKSHEQALSAGTSAIPRRLSVRRDANAYLVSRRICCPGWRALSVADGEGATVPGWLRRASRSTPSTFTGGRRQRRACWRRRGVNVDYAVANALELAWPKAMYDVIVAIFIQFATPRRTRTPVRVGPRCAQARRHVHRAGLSHRAGVPTAPAGPSDLSQLYSPDQLRPTSPASTSRTWPSTTPRSTRAAGTAACRRSSAWWRASLTNAAAASCASGKPA